MKQDELNRIIENHKHWLMKDIDGWEEMRANLSGANLSGATLSGANLYGANLSGAYHLEKAKGLYLPQTCPTDGEFTAWKKCRNGTVVKLLIPDTALRSSASGRKCRASEAVVLTIYDKDGNEVNEARSGHDSDFVYRVGETVKPVQKFDTNRWNECAPGIHFLSRGRKRNGMKSNVLEPMCKVGRVE